MPQRPPLQELHQRSFLIPDSKCSHEYFKACGFVFCCTDVHSWASRVTVRVHEWVCQRKCLVLMKKRKPSRLSARIQQMLSKHSGCKHSANERAHLWSETVTCGEVALRGSKLDHESTHLTLAVNRGIYLKIRKNNYFREIGYVSN